MEIQPGGGYMGKRIRVVWMIIAVILLMTACQKVGTPSTYTVTMNDTVFTVDPGNSTISDGINTYRYEYSGSAQSYTTTIIYPDGSTYWWSTTRNGNFSHGSGGWSDDYDENRYVAGDVLCDVIKVKTSTKSDDKDPIMIMLLIVIGLFNVISPYSSWYLSSGWKNKDAEPSEEELGIARFGGVAALVIAVIMIIV